jgi:uncharacterized phage protein gp47/JayE
MIPKTTEQIIQLFRKELSTSGSELANFYRYSNLHLIYRSIASILSEQDTDIKITKDTGFISTSTGEDLDYIGRDFSVYRDEGNKARGYVLASNSSLIEIPPGTILNIASQALQYETLERRVLSNNIPQSIPIVSLSSSSLYNISAGTVLYNSIFPSTSFIVGRYSTNGRYYPDLVGGSDLEEDDSFRDRILRKIVGTEFGTYGAIYDAVKSLPFISQVIIKDSLPVPGYFTVYIDTADTVNINTVRRLVNNIKPIGVGFVIRPILYTSFSIVARVRVNRIEEGVLNNIKTRIRDLTTNLRVDEHLSRDSILASIMRVNGVISVSLTSPSGDLIPASQQVVSIDNIQIDLYE